jgi:hypothetical protein
MRGGISWVFGLDKYHANLDIFSQDDINFVKKTFMKKIFTLLALFIAALSERNADRKFIPGN